MTGVQTCALPIYISEHYDVSFNPDNLDQDVMVDLLDIERDGRLIYVELDL